MPEFLITSPEGKQYRVTGPEGSTKEQALVRVQAQLGQAAKPQQREPGWAETIAASPMKGLAQGADFAASIVDPLRGLQNIGHFVVPGSIPAPNVFSLGEAAERISPTPSDPTKRIAQSVASAVANPATYAGGGASILGKAATGALGAFGGEIAGMLSEDNRWARLFGGLLAGGAPSALKAGASRLVPKIPEARVEPLKTLREEFKTEPTAEDVLHSEAVRQTMRLGDRMFGGGKFTKAKMETEKQVSGAALREMGVNTEKEGSLATPEVLERAEKRMGDTFSRTMDIIRLKHDEPMGDEFSRITRQMLADGNLTTEQMNQVDRLQQHILAQFPTGGKIKDVVVPKGMSLEDALGVFFDENGEYRFAEKPALPYPKAKGRTDEGIMKGTTYHGLTQYNGMLGMAMRSENAAFAYYAAQIKEALDAALERSAAHPGRGYSKENQTKALADFNEARRQWWAKLMIEKAVSKRGQDEAEGLIQVRHLASALAAKDRFTQYVKGKTRLDQLARAGEAIISPRPNFGQDPMGHLGMGVHGLMGLGTWLTAIGHPQIGLPMLMGPPGIGRLANSEMMQNWLKTARMKSVLNQMNAWSALRGAAVSDPERKERKKPQYGGTSE